MRRKMYATAMTAMLVTGTLMGLAVPAAKRDGVTLHGVWCVSGTGNSVR